MFKRIIFNIPDSQCEQGFLFLNKDELSSMDLLLKKTTLSAFVLFISLCTQNMVASDGHVNNFNELDSQYQKNIKPLIKKFCIECHSTEANEGELDLEQFTTLKQIRKNTTAWLKIREMLDLEEMPPEDSPQFSKPQKEKLQKWISEYLHTEATINAGDPGKVILRRLNNSEYNYTIQDLTGIDLNPSKNFPVDGAAGEGFTNTGISLVMSPSLVSKYLDSGKNIASHVVLLPNGFRFSAGKTRRDWTNEILDEIRAVYLKYTGSLGDANALNKWRVSKPGKLTERDGRVNLKQYFDLLIQYRSLVQNNPNELMKIARQNKLSPVYISHLRKMLLSENPSLLFKEIQILWKNKEGKESATIASKIHKWQEKMWRYNEVGHFGPINGWQKAVPLVKQSVIFRKKLVVNSKSNKITLYLTADSAGDGNKKDFAVWNDIRIERPSYQPVYLRDIKAFSYALSKAQEDLAKNISKYLEIAFTAKVASQKIDIQQLAEENQLTPFVLKALLEYLGISYSSDLVVEQYLNLPMNNIAGYPHVKGWGVSGLTALSIISNSSDKIINIPGKIGPHKIVVHPRPKRWIATGWKSPFQGNVDIKIQIKDAHSQCGNGVSWSLELRRGYSNQVLKSGVIKRGGQISEISVKALNIKKNELISLVIGPKDGNHGCDTTSIDLLITENNGQKRKWSLTEDCADRIHLGNPLSDTKGNSDVWHFHTGVIGPNKQKSTIPEKSLLAHWLKDDNEDSARKTATKIQALLSNGLNPKTTPSDKKLYQQLTSLQGSLLSRMNLKELLKSVKPEELVDSEFGLNRDLFGKDLTGKEINEYALHVKAPSVYKIILPANLFSGGELVTTANLSIGSNGESSVQFQLSDVPTEKTKNVNPGIPVVTHSKSPAETRFQTAFKDFRNLFPAAMCYTRIVPVDVGVSLILFFREDDNFANLLLTDQEKKQLDQLWSELHYVSQDALTSVTVFEQLLEFATQDGNPAMFEPLREIIYGDAKSHKALQLESESSHLNQLIEYANRIYRRPLSSEEKTKLRQLYQILRKQKMSHESSFRLTMARIFSSPSFLYKIENPDPGKVSTPVSDRELANRLSYFLWSSLPDEKLFGLSASRQLSNPEVLTQQVRRMIQSQKSRRLAVEFGCQWLHIRNFDKHDEKNEKLYPQFTDLKADMYEESIQFLQDLLQHDRSVLNLLDSDYTFLNEKLAKLYKIPGVTGNHWRLVKGIKKYGRGGILGQASILSKHSGASRTSPILRGNWVSETILGDKLPKPPADVPILSETVPEGLTERQLIEQHSSNVSCAKCHKRMDPYGFALENYDTIGRFRNKTKNKQDIDTKTTLMDGTRIDGYLGLRNYLLTSRRDTFLRQFCKKLLGYALGRGVKLSDEPLLELMQKNLANNEYRISSAIETIVLSRQFREIRGKDYAGLQ